MIRGFTIFLFLISLECVSQQAVSDIEIEQHNVVKKTVSFNHVPFLLLKLNPSQMLASQNVMLYGIEIAPPVGKFSFSFDYGIGKGKFNASKYVRTNQAKNKNTEYRGEIRMYFSDWYPFYALDKKPFGRYYAIEYVKGEYQTEAEMAVGVGGMQLPNYARFQQAEIDEKREAIHLKVGKHIHLHRFLFLDIFAGLGLGRFQVASTANDELVPLHFAFLSNRNLHQPGTKGYFFSKTSGIRLAIPL
jgi:hypothetical protein